jgi:hypothetical protein
MKGPAMATKTPKPAPAPAPAPALDVAQAPEAGEPRLTGRELGDLAMQQLAAGNVPEYRRLLDLSLHATLAEVRG